MVLSLLAGELGDLTSAAPQAIASAGAALQTLTGNWWALVLGVILIAATVLIVGYLKNLLANSLIGLVAWAVLHFLLHIQLPLVPSLVVSAIFGLAGIGALLVLRFLGVNF